MQEYNRPMGTPVTAASAGVEARAGDGPRPTDDPARAASSLMNIAEAGRSAKRSGWLTYRSTQGKAPTGPMADEAKAAVRAARIQAIGMLGAIRELPRNADQARDTAEAVAEWKQAVAWWELAAPGGWADLRILDGGA